jgi:hypothetical protein
MAITITPVKGGNYALSNKRAKTFDITLDNSYPTNGYTFGGAQVGLKSVEMVVTHGFRKSDNSAYVGASMNSGKLVLFSGGSQVANATDLSAYSGRVVVIGTGTA